MKWWGSARSSARGQRNFGVLGERAKRTHSESETHEMTIAQFHP